jgi:hypothetical protein
MLGRVEGILPSDRGQDARDTQGHSRPRHGWF